MSPRSRSTVFLGLTLSVFAFAPITQAAGNDLATLKTELAELKKELADQKAKVDGMASKTVEKEVVAQFVDAQKTPPGAQPATIAEVEALKAEIAELKVVQASAEEARMAEEMEKITATTNEAEKPSLKLYGFVETGFNKMFLKDANPTRGLYMREGNFVFVPGTMNLYLDAKNGKGFRALMETRYTYYPSGEIVSTGTGKLKPTDTRVYDVFSSSGYNKVSWSGVVIERAHIDYEAHPLLTLRVGYFLTPYGIWNVDHGTPTLISIILPQFQIVEAIPQRLAGVQALGEVSFAPYALGYRLYASNGRSFQVSAPSADNGYGGRLYLRRSGDATMTWGTSFYTGTFADKVVNMVFDPTNQSVNFQATNTYKAREYSIGGDFSLDYGNFRARAEILVRRVNFADGLHQPTSDPTKYQPNRWENFSYVLASYRIGQYVEPFLYAEAKYVKPDFDTDMVHGYSGGLNLYFTSTAMVKTQYGQFYFKNRSGPSISNDNFGFLVSRFIYVF